MEVDRIATALENARRVGDRMHEAVLRDRDRRLQYQTDEEGCGAVLGDLLARVWQQEDEDMTDAANPKRDPQIGREVERIMRRVARAYDRVGRADDDDALLAFVSQLLGTLGYNLARNFEGNHAGKQALGKALVETFATGWAAQMQEEVVLRGAVEGEA